MAQNKKANVDDLKMLRDLLPTGVNPRDTVWDCHGTWVMYHRYIELIAANNNVEIVSLDLCDVREKSAVVRCEVEAGDRKIITFGEASPANCKNAYPVAMAEKRAVDRAVLKAVLIHGTIYSENEDETFAASPPPAQALAPATPAPAKAAPQIAQTPQDLMTAAEIAADDQTAAVKQGAIQALAATSVEKLRSEFQMWRKNVAASSDETDLVTKLFSYQAKTLEEN